MNNMEQSESVTYKSVERELKAIEEQLSFRSLYSLLGCAKGLLKAQEPRLSNKNIISIKFKGERKITNKGRKVNDTRRT